MLIKVNVEKNVEKAYDALEWETILSTLKIMNFPTTWILWIKTYVSSSSFAYS